jgi:hypothetical protein
MKSIFLTKKTLDKLLQEIEIVTLGELYNDTIISIVITPLPHQWIATITMV